MGSIRSIKKYYRIRAVGTARHFGLPRVGLSDQFLAGGPNFVANSASRGVGDTLRRKIDFKYDHFKASYGDGDGRNLSLSTVTFPQITRRIELVAIPKYFVFGGAMRVVNLFDGPGSAGFLDSYNSKNPTNPNTGSPQVVNNNIPGPNTTSYYGLNPLNSTYLADAHNGDVSVGAKNFAEDGPIWGDVTTNGGNVTHSGYQISGTIDNNVPFTIPPLKNPDLTSNTTLEPDGSIKAGGGGLVGPGASQGSPTIYVYNSAVATDSLTITNGNVNNASNPFAYATVVINGHIKKPIHIAQGVQAQIWFTGNMDLKGSDLDNQ